MDGWTKDESNKDETNFLGVVDCFPSEERDAYIGDGTTRIYSNVM